MFLLEVKMPSKSVKKELPRTGLLIDPRPIYDHSIMAPFEITYSYHGNGTSVTITKSDDDTDKYHDDDGSRLWKFRVYDSAKEVVPSFDSKIYTYLGVLGERAPIDTLMGIIDSSVYQIKENAFDSCKEMKICVMDDGVEEIEPFAFSDCTAMKTIRLSRSLRWIGSFAFRQCKSLDALFFPSKVDALSSDTCYDCKNIRIISFPTNITGDTCFEGCDTFFGVTQIEGYKRIYDSDFDSDESDVEIEFDSEEVHKSIFYFNQDLPPLNQECLDDYVSSQSIHDCVRTHGTAAAFATDHNGMTPLHILVINPHATSGSILSCLGLNMSAAFVSDHTERTPIEYLWEYDRVEALVSVIQALCLHREANGERSRHDTNEGSHKTKKKRVN